MNRKLISKGGTIVEGTAGNTGIGLAVVCKEYEINLEVTWTLIHQNESIIESTQYKEMGDYSFNRNQILGKENESTFIKESLAKQLAEKIFLRMNEVL